jgi:DNA-binding SARP family transcriptional activator/TolB-like protein
LFPAPVRPYIWIGRIAAFSPSHRQRIARRIVLSLRLFGGLSIETSARPVTGRAAQRRRLALLALLATSRGLGREKLVACLWPETDSERGRRLLSDSVYRINQALGPGTVQATGDELRLDPERLPSDVAAFEQALAEQRWADAVALYSGPFLDGFFLDGSSEFEQWTARERERLSRLYAGALQSLAEAASAQGELSQATQWWYRAAAHDPLSPRVALRLMEALEAAGERAAALRHAGVHEALFRQEIGADVDPEVLAFAERLRRADAAPQEPAVTAAAQPEDSAPPRTAPAPRTVPAPASEPAPRTAPAPARAPAGLWQPAAAPAAGTRQRSRFLMAAGIGLLLLLVAAGWIAFRNGPGRSTIPVTAVAVLPFDDHSPGRDHGYLANGVMEEVAGALTRIGGLRVVASPGAMAASDDDIQKVGQDLGVGTVLGGSITRWGDSVRINAKLIRVADRAYLWSETYTSGMVSIFAIQDSISRAIAGTLFERLVGDPARQALPEPSPEELAAYNLYLKGRFAWHRRTQASLASAVEYFDQAVTAAPGYARAYAGLADAYAVQGFYDFRPPRDAFTRAEAAARTALALNPELAQPHATLAYVSLYYHWDWADAERSFAQALRLDPGYSTGHQWQANYFTAMGRFREAERSMRRAMELDPLSLIANGALGWVYYHAGEYERAIDQCNRTLELDPEFRLAWFWSALAHAQLGRTDEAITLLERAQALSPEDALTEAALAHVLASAGQTDEARTMLQRLLSVPDRYVPSYEIAKIFVALGDQEAALDWLERALEQRSHSMAFLRVDPQLAPLQAHPRFRDLLRNVGHVR